MESLNNNKSETLEKKAKGGDFFFWKPPRERTTSVQAFEGSPPGDKRHAMDRKGSSSSW